MKHPSFLFLLMILIFVPAAIHAQQPDTLFLEFHFEGMGNLVTMSPPMYFFDIVSGDPLVLNGTWWFQLDDSEWPPTSDPDVRWDYIFNNYFEYAGAPQNSWTAVFDGNSLPTKPVWELSHPVNGTMGGELVLNCTLLDWNGDGILQPDERMVGTFSGTLMVMKYGTGYFSIYCGQGAYNGYSQNADPINFADDWMDGDCILELINCQHPTRDVSWGVLKQLYR
jgi:hypothetical protein